MKFLKFDSLNTREKILLFAAGFIVLMSIFQWLLVLPFLRKAKDLDAAIKDMKSNVTIGQNELNKQKIVENEYKKIKHLLGRSLSDAEAINDMKGQVEDIAQKAGLKFGPAMQRDITKEEAWREYRVELPKVESEVGFNMTSLIDFVYRIQESDAMFRVEKINLSPDQGSRQLKGSIIISKIMLPPEETSAVGKPPEVQRPSGK